MTRYGDHLEVSNSEIQTFKDCQRRWWLSYHRRLKPKQEKPHGPLSVGGRTHKALETGYSSPGREEAMRRVLAESIEADYALAEELGCVDEFEKDAELVVIMLEGFVEWAAEEGLDAEWEVVSEERVVKAPPTSVLGVDVVLKGKLDQVVRRLSDGSLWMRDWKTTQEKQPFMMQFRPQLLLYLLLLQLTEPSARVSGAQFVFLRKVKRTARAEPPFYMQELEYVSSREMEAFWRQLQGTLRRLVQTTLELEAGGDHQELAPPRQTRDCSWRCPFAAVCPMFDDGSDVERALSDLYEAGDPYEYYDEQLREETA